VIWHDAIAENPHRNLLLRFVEDAKECGIIAILAKQSSLCCRPVKDMKDIAPHRLARTSGHRGTSVGVGNGFAAESMIAKKIMTCETFPDPVGAAALSAPISRSEPLPIRKYPELPTERGQEEFR
jgi:hypothetical protein